MRALLLVAALAPALALVVSACASAPPEEGPPPPPPGRAGGPGPLRCARLFVSPAGEPFRAGPEATACPLAAWFAKADADGDGALTPAEFRADALRFFGGLDVNGDGMIDGAELQRYEHDIVPEMLGRGAGGPRAEAAPTLERAAYVVQAGPGGMGGMGGMGGGGMGGGGGRGGGRGGGGLSEGAPGGGPFGVGGLARFGLLDEPEPVAGADLDFDGRITRAEFSTRADQRFSTLDAAGEGRLTLPVLEARLRAKSHAPQGARPSGARPGGGGSGGGGRRGGGGVVSGFGGPPG